MGRRAAYRAGMSIASDRLARYLDAEKRVLEGKSVRMGDREVRLEDLPEIRKGIEQLKRDVSVEAAAAAGRSNPGIALASFS